MAELKPGSFIGDSVEEFKKLPTWGKVAAVGVLVVVAFLAWRAHAASSSAQTAAASTAGSPLGSAGAAATGTQSPFPMVGNLPVLPGNVNPVFDSSGNPIAFQQGPTGSPPSTNPGPIPMPPGPNPPPSPTSSPCPPGLLRIIGGPDAGGCYQPTPSPTPTPGPNPSPGPSPLIPYGQLPAGANLSWGNKVNWQGTQYIVGPGSNGILWGVASNSPMSFQQWQNTPIAPGQKIMLYQNQQPQGHGSGPGSMLAFMNDPLVYLVSAKPHVSSMVPQR